MAATRALLLALLLLLALAALAVRAHDGHDAHGDEDDGYDDGEGDDGFYDDGAYDDDGGDYDGPYDDAGYDGPYDDGGVGPFDAGDQDGFDADAMADFEAGLSAKMASMKTPFSGMDPNAFDMGSTDFGDLPDLEAAISEFGELSESMDGGDGKKKKASAPASDEGADEDGAQRQQSPLPIGLNCAEVMAPTMKKTKELVRGGLGRVGEAY